MLQPVRVYFLLLLFSFLECTPLYHSPQTNPPEENPFKKIRIRVITQDRGYALGGPVDMKLEIENISAEVVRLNFDSNLLFDFKIYTKGWEVWRWSYDKTFEKTTLRLSIYPKEVWTFQAEWDTKDNQRKWVLGGRYYIEGILNCSPPLKSEQVEIGLTD
ncbi:MAG TPA: BsuPI-related putative proteinase inhibitor [Terriglobales bacterium]|nr:BsuPI-related putative proteinase inhibitor [Terriglobales bacterium]